MLLLLLRWMLMLLLLLLLLRWTVVLLLLRVWAEGLLVMRVQVRRLAMHSRWQCCVSSLCSTPKLGLLHAGATEGSAAGLLLALSCTVHRHCGFIPRVLDRLPQSNDPGLGPRLFLDSLDEPD